MLINVHIVTYVVQTVFVQKDILNSELTENLFNRKSQF